MSDLKSRFDQVQSRVQKSAERAGRNPAEIKIIAVSKTFLTPLIRSFIEATGYRSLGENYAKELGQKAGELSSLAIEWHYLGHLQSNKIRSIVEDSHTIHALASLQHAAKISQIAVELKKNPFPVYIGVNVSSEAQKSGISLEQVPSFYDSIKSNKNLDVQGLMSVPPRHYSDDTFSGGEIPDIYKRLKHASTKIGRGLLSLGMSGDMEIAIAAGSTCVRIGRAIFGERNAYANEKSSD